MAVAGVPRRERSAHSSLHPSNRRHKARDGTLYLYTLPLLSAPSRESLAGSGGVARLRVPLPRLERAHHGRVLRAERRVAHSGSGDGRIASIVNNYRQISFNFGPTLLSWMEEHARRAYEGCSGGPGEPRTCSAATAIAHRAGLQPHDLPLANRARRETQILWGIRDFQRRFGRDPEGMWLPETAAGLWKRWRRWPTTASGSQFWRHTRRGKCERWARGGWHDVEGAKIDPTRAYVCPLPSGKEIATVLL